MKTKRFKVSSCLLSILLWYKWTADWVSSFLFTSLTLPAWSHWNFSTLKLASTLFSAYPGYWRWPLLLNYYISRIKVIRDGKTHHLCNLSRSTPSSSSTSALRPFWPKPTSTGQQQLVASSLFTHPSISGAPLTALFLCLLCCSQGDPHHYLPSLLPSLQRLSLLLGLGLQWIRIH